MFDQTEPFLEPVDFDVGRKVLFFSSIVVSPSRSISRRGLLRTNIVKTILRTNILKTTLGSQNSDYTILKTVE